MLPTCNAHNAVEALELELEDAAAEGREAIIPAPLVIVAGALWRHFFDQGRAEHSLYGSVKRPGTHADRPGGRFVDLTGDGVAMPLATGEGEHDVEHGRREWELRIRVALGHGRLYPSRMYPRKMYVSRRPSAPMDR